MVALRLSKLTTVKFNFVLMTSLKYTRECGSHITDLVKNQYFKMTSLDPKIPNRYYLYIKKHNKISLKQQVIIINVHELYR